MATDFLDPKAAQRSLTYFALGGSGIRALEPLLHLCALGLGPRQLNVVMIDPDQSNAAVDRSKSLLDLYCRIRGALLREGSLAEGYFRTEVKDVVGQSVLWSPIADEDNQQSAVFQSRVDRPLMNGPSKALGELFDLLYAERIRKMDLTLGFRGVPSIGTVFMNRLREQPFFQQLLTTAQTDAGSVFFAVGSLFGGTGAAALPVVGRALVDGIQEEGRNGIRGLPSHRVGSALLMPYFTLPAPPAAVHEDGGPRPEAAVFAQNAAAALPTYTSGQARFGAYYVIGDGEPREQEKNAVGGAAQENPSHYVELYAALAALDFTARGGETPTASVPVFRTIAVGQNNVQWSDLPISEASRRRLMGGFVAVHTYLTVFRPDAQAQPGLGEKLEPVTWMQLAGLGRREIEGNAELLDDLGAFFLRTWMWAGEMNGSAPALDLVRSTSKRPSEVRLDEMMVRSGAARPLPRTSTNGLQIFRHWNVAASKRRVTGIAGMLEVMREGSEAVL